MRAIGVVTTDEQARRLGGYLLTLGIASQTEPVPAGYCVWIHDEDKVTQARQEFDAFVSNPSDARYAAAIETAEQIRAKQSRVERQYRRQVRDISTSWRRPVPQGCPVTVAFVGVCVAVAIVSRMGKEIQPVLQHLFITQFAAFLPEVRSGEVWRLVTPILIHFGPVHLLFNLWNFYNLGGIFEILRGSTRFTLFILVTAVISNLAQYFHSGPAFGGMSGVLYGLFGYIWMKSRFDPQSGMYLPQETVILMIAWLFICMTGRVGPIANTAHVAGLLCGVAIGLGPILWRRFVS